MKNIQIINISLVLAIIILAANPIFPLKDSIGKALYNVNYCGLKSTKVSFTSEP